MKFASLQLLDWICGNVESLLGDRAIRESLLESSGNYLHFGSPGIKLYKFKGSEDLRTDEEKLSGSTTPLTPEQIDQTNREHTVYQKLLSAYDAARMMLCTGSLLRFAQAIP